MNTPEERIVYFIEMLKDSGMIKFKKELFDKTELTRQHYTKVKNGNIRFTSNQIMSICVNYPLNANWVFGTETNMFRDMEKYTIDTKNDK